VTDKGPIREADLIMGESYDARLEQGDWCMPGFNADDWDNAINAEDNGSTKAIFSDVMGQREVELGFQKPGRMRAYSGPPVRAIEEITPVSLSEYKPGIYVFDLGQNFAGNIRLKVKGPAGTKLQIRYGEMTHPDGRLMTENLRRARTTDYYTLRGDEAGETWTPRFTYHGFRYVEVTGLPNKPGLDAVTGIVIHSDTPLTSSFECSDPMVNRLFKNVVWTQRANFIEIPTDCPQRDERLGWMGDAQIYVRTATYNADVWKVYGDTRIIERHYASMKRFMDFRQKSSPDHKGVSIGNPWGDWLNLNETTPVEYIDACYYANSAKMMAGMAAAIGREEDAAEYRKLLADITAAFDREYVQPDGLLKVQTQTAYVLALNFGLLPENDSNLAGDHLAGMIEKNGFRMATGFLGTKSLLPVLSATGHQDLAVRLFQGRAFPSWGYEVENGATTVWERWDSYTKEHGFDGFAGHNNAAMNSFSHYSFGAVCEWMFRSLAGIDTDGDAPFSGPACGALSAVVRDRKAGFRLASRPPQNWRAVS
jgi:alpha-L-rhamnosidase